MFTKLLAVPLVIATSVVALPSTLGRRATSDVSLADWPSQNLESYWSFRTRFLHLGCDQVPNTEFYTTCCYPLGASESLSDRPAQCKPAECSAPTNSIQSTPTTPSDDDEDDSNLPFCEPGQSEYEDDDYVASANVAPTVDYTPPAIYTPPADSSSAAQEQPTQDTPAPSPTPGNGGNTGNNGNVNTGGFATWFYQGGNAGACGQYHGDYDLIAAIDQRRYGYDFSQPSSLCGQKVQIRNPANGNSVEVVIADVCPTCDNENSIDLSLGAFQALADLGVGHLPIEWNFA